MMKLKSNQTRTYDGDGYKKRAACLCFRSEQEEEVSPPVCLPGKGPASISASVPPTINKCGAGVLFLLNALFRD